MSVFPGANVVLGLVLAPFLLGVINRIKAMFAGRRGPPLLQAYYDLAKLLRKGAVYSRTTTWVFRVAPVIGLVSVLGALALLPALDTPGLVAFPSDLILFAYCLGLMRFFTVAAAMDTRDVNRAMRLTACLVERYQRVTGMTFHEGSITADMTQYHTFSEISPGTPAAIIETGFLYLDRDFLTTRADQVAEGIVQGILCFVNNESVEATPAFP